MTNTTNKKSAVRTRIAPSPTGEDMHIGNVYTALINYAVAKKNNGSFVVRIEDTDRTRYVERAEEKILSTLKSFGLTYDEGPDVGGPFAPYRQSDRLELYKNYAEELVKKGKAYYCFCTKERLETLRKEQTEKKQVPKYDKRCRAIQNSDFRIQNGEPYVVRLNVEPDKTIWFEDVIRGNIVFHSSDIDDQVLLKSDGYPTYHLGVVVDDHLMEISHVIRAEEWISSTPKHVMLYEAFSWKLPVFAHVPILRNPDKSKLSKRKNPVWASWYLEQGFLPEAILNYLALMGWSHPQEIDVFSLSEFIKLFELKDLKPVGPVFDIQKLEWLNGVWLRRIFKQNPDELKKRLKRFYQDDKTVLEILSGIHVDLFIAAAQSRMKTLKDFKTLVVEPEKTKSYSAKEKEVAQKLLQNLRILKKPWTDEILLAAMKTVREETKVSNKTLYFLLTGKEKGLPILELLKIYGEEYFIEKLQRNHQA